MSWNLLLWKWAPEFDSPAKRKKARLKFGDIANQFALSGDHPAIGEGDITSFCGALDATFGADELARPFVLEQYPKCAVVSYANSDRFEIVPKVANIGRKFGVNAAEF